MRYKASEMERIFGLSPNGFKLYEKYGIIQPARKTTSGYRVYSELEGHLMVRAQQLRKYGFSMKETAEIVRKDSISEQAVKLMELSENMGREIEQLQRIRRCAAIQAKRMYEFQNIYRTCVLDKNPAMYHLTTKRGNEVISQENMRRNSRWVKQYLPFTTRAQIYPQAFWQEQADPLLLAVGSFLDAEDALFLNIQKDDYTTYYPERPCILTGIKTAITNQQNISSVAHTLEYIRKVRIDVYGDALARTVGSGKENGKEYRYDYLWIPIEPGITHLPNF